jgi:hypothetical protein
VLTDTYKKRAGNEWDEAKNGGPNDPVVQSVRLYAYRKKCGYLFWRAVDQHATELGILLQKRRDKAAAKRFSSACLPHVLQHRARS